VTEYRYIPVVSMIAKGVLRGLVFIVLGGILIFAFMMRSTNWDRNPLDQMLPGEEQDQRIHSR
jgi:hypothetical protein